MMKVIVAALVTGALALGAAGCSSSAKSEAPTTPTTDAGAGGYDFSDVHAYLFGGEWKTEGVVVLAGGKLVYEDYAAGWDATKRHITYSVSKSIGSALVGIAVADGALSIEDSVCKTVTPDAGSDPKLCDIKIKDLLHMSSGLRWVEDYGDDPSKSDVLPMLYGFERDMGLYALRRPREVDPGTRFAYSSGDSNLLARALRGALGDKDMRAWAREKLFGPAGIDSAVFETDKSGSLVFSSSCFMTPRDMARFGELYRNGGTIDGKRVLSDDWIKQSITPAPPVAQPTPRTAGAAPGDSGGSYGFQWWLNAASPSAGVDTLAYPDMPADAYLAEGHWGQGIVVIPSRQVVIARVGNDRDKVFDRGPLAAKVLAALEKGGAK